MEQSVQLAAVISLAAAVFVGASTQRISGMGFALVASPFLVIVLGPHAGITLVNLLGAKATKAEVASAVKTAAGE